MPNYSRIRLKWSFNIRKNVVKNSVQILSSEKGILDFTSRLRKWCDYSKLNVVKLTS
jgi:hypothetical protein